MVGNCNHSEGGDAIQTQAKRNQWPPASLPRHAQGQAKAHHPVAWNWSQGLTCSRFWRVESGCGWVRRSNRRCDAVRYWPNILHALAVWSLQTKVMGCHGKRMEAESGADISQSRLIVSSLGSLANFATKFLTRLQDFLQTHKISCLLVYAVSQERETLNAGKTFQHIPHVLPKSPWLAQNNGADRKTQFYIAWFRFKRNLEVKLQVSLEIHEVGQTFIHLSAPFRGFAPDDFKFASRRTQFRVPSLHPNTWTCIKLWKPLPLDGLAIYCFGTLW